MNQKTVLQQFFRNCSRKVGLTYHQPQVTCDVHWSRCRAMQGLGLSAPQNSCTRSCIDIADSRIACNSEGQRSRDVHMPGDKRSCEDAARGDGILQNGSDAELEQELRGRGVIFGAKLTTQELQQLLKLALENAAMREQLQASKLAAIPEGLDGRLQRQRPRPPQSLVRALPGVRPVPEPHVSQGLGGVSRMQSGYARAVGWSTGFDQELSSHVRSPTIGSSLPL